MLCFPQQWRDVGVFWHSVGHGRVAVTRPFKPLDPSMTDAQQTAASKSNSSVEVMLEGFEGDCETR